MSWYHVKSRTENTMRLTHGEIPATRMEQELFCFLANNPHKALSRETLLKEVWKYEHHVPTRTIDAHVKKLRKHLGKYRESIVTVRGVGYRFEPENIPLPTACRLTDGGVCCEMDH